VRSSIFKSGLYLLLSLLILTMLVTLLQYARLDDHTGFLQYKQDWLDDPVWKSAFYIHVFTCFFCLFAGLTQFSKEVMRRQKKTHRLLGKIYVFNILFINVPVGMILAVNANGGLISKVAFSLLGVLWCYTTLMAWLYAKRKQFTLHRQFMIRSYALTLSALTLRLWKPVLMNLTTLDTYTIYQIDAWLGFGLNLLVAEWIIRREINQRSR
jgi:uncharacterized membrane protein